MSARHVASSARMNLGMLCTSSSSEWSGGMHGMMSVYAPSHHDCVCSSHCSDVSVAGSWRNTSSIACACVLYAGCFCDIACRSLSVCSCVMCGIDVSASHMLVCMCSVDAHGACSCVMCSVCSPVRREMRCTRCVLSAADVRASYAASRHVKARMSAR